MQATMLLCDHAQMYDGKLCVLGGGWTVVGPTLPATAVVVLIRFAPPEQGRSYHLELYLLGADGAPVHLPTDAGEVPVEVRADISAGSSAGLLEGTDVTVTTLVPLPALPLQPGTRYTWHLTLDGDEPTGGTVDFAVQPPATEPTA